MSGLAKVLLNPEEAFEIQHFADVYPDIIDSFPTDRSQARDLDEHLIMYSTWLRRAYVEHNRHTVLAVKGFMRDGLVDVAAALNGVRGATFVHYPEATPSERVSIARESFSVLVNLAIDRSLVTRVQAPGTVPRNRTIKPERLNAASSGNPRIVIDHSVEPDHDMTVYEGIACPAFVGKVAASRRLPSLMWNTTIDLYNAHGQFE